MTGCPTTTATSRARSSSEARPGEAKYVRRGPPSCCSRLSTTLSLPRPTPPVGRCYDKQASPLRPRLPSQRRQDGEHAGARFGQIAVVRDHVVSDANLVRRRLLSANAGQGGLARGAIAVHDPV